MRRLIWLVLLLGSYAHSAELIVSPKATLTSQDVMSALKGQLRDFEREQILSNKDQLRRVVDGYYLSKAAAADARQNGLDRDPEIKAKIEKLIIDILAQAQIEFLVEKELEGADFDEAAEEYYKAHKDRYTTPEVIEASHILIKVDEQRSEEEALRLIGEIRAKVMADPSSFETLAKTHSEDQGSASKGGALGAFGHKRMVKPFSEAAFKLKTAGELSEAVRTSFGFHLIRLDKPYVPGYKAFEEVRPEVIKKLTGDVRRLVREEYLISLRDAPDIRVDHKNLEAFLKDPVSASRMD